jgi:ubiquinone/menaquinone biosynthesis C-methylase UbiE
MRFATVGVSVTVLALCAWPAFPQHLGHAKIEPNSMAPYVSSPQSIVERMLEVAGVKSGETVYDLGCGDGRILITAVQRYHAKAVGVELNEKHAETAVDNIKRLNLQNRAQVIKGNLMDVPIANADVVTLYLMTLSNDQLRPKLERELKPGTRVVSLNYQIRGWKAKAIEDAEAYHRPYKIYLYEVPSHQ